MQEQSAVQLISQSFIAVSFAIQPHGLHLYFGFSISDYH